MAKATHTEVRERNALKAGLFIVISFVTAIVVVLLIRGQSRRGAGTHGLVYPQ